MKCPDNCKGYFWGKCSTCKVFNYSRKEENKNG